MAAARPVAVRVEGQAALLLYPGVHQAVAGAGVVAGAVVGGNQADVGNAADVDEDGGAVAEQAALE